MSVAIFPQTIPANLVGVVHVNEHQQLIIENQQAAQRILFGSDANSLEYRIVQVALQCQTQNELMSTRNAISAGRAKIVHLEKELTESRAQVASLTTEVQDMQTAEKLRELEIKFNKEARTNGWLNIAEGVALIPLIVPFAIGFLMIGVGIGKLVEKPEDLLLLEDQMGLYKEFYPETTFTQAFEYAQKNPIKYRKAEIEKFATVETYREKFPAASFDDFKKYVGEKIHMQKLLEARLGPKRYR